MKKTCNNCEWLYEEHCCNGVSDMCTEAVSKDDYCDKWGDRRMSDLDKNIDKLKKVVKVSTLDDTEKLDLIIFLDEVALLEVEE